MLCFKRWNPGFCRFTFLVSLHPLLDPDPKFLLHLVTSTSTSKSNGKQQGFIVSTFSVITHLHSHPSFFPYSVTSTSKSKSDVKPWMRHIMPFLNLDKTLWNVSFSSLEFLLNSSEHSMHIICTTFKECKNVIVIQQELTRPLNSFLSFWDYVEFFRGRKEWNETRGKFHFSLFT